MSARTVPAREPSPISMLAGWLRQGTESFFASQQVLMDLAMRQNANAISAFQGRLTEARNIVGTAATEMAGEGISNFIAAQRVLLNLAQRQSEIVATVVKERVGGPAPVAAVTDLFSRGVETVIGMQQHFLTLAARQADEWIDATKSGEPFEGIHLTALARESMETFVRSQKKFLDVLAEETAHATEGNGQRTAAKTELAELARQSAEAYIDAQKKLLDVATQQLKVNAKTAREAMEAINPMPVETLGKLARNTVDGFLESQQSLLNLMVKPPKPAKTHEAPTVKTRKRTARRKPVAETV
uniref:Uncharacterized protein n=1 Tax=Solibacter usitatus (strain Ellin6076) TaxID=234267 RepID=Q027M9_SOLUE